MTARRGSTASLQVELPAHTRGDAKIGRLALLRLDFERGLDLPFSLQAPLAAARLRNVPDAAGARDASKQGAVRFGDVAEADLAEQTPLGWLVEKRRTNLENRFFRFSSG